MALKEYEVDTPAGKTTVQLSDEDAKERGLSGGKTVQPAEQLDSATGAPKKEASASNKAQKVADK